MALQDVTENETVITEQTHKISNHTDWLRTGAGNKFQAIFEVYNLSGTTPTLDWSLEHSNNPDGMLIGADADATTELLAASALTQVNGTTLPHSQTYPVGVGADALNNKEYVRAVWTLGGTAVATVGFKVKKI